MLLYKYTLCTLYFSSLGWGKLCLGDGDEGSTLFLLTSTVQFHLRVTAGCPEPSLGAAEE